MSLDYFEGTTLQASVAEIAFSVGMIIGGIILGMCGGFKNRGIGISISIALMGVPIFISGLLPQNGFWGFAFLCVIMGISGPFYNGPVTALMQERIAADYLGRVFGLYSSAASLAMPVGLIISGFFADGIGVNKWFLITGILIVFISVLCHVIPSIKILIALRRKMNEKVLNNLSAMFPRPALVLYCIPMVLLIQCHPVHVHGLPPYSMFQYAILLKTHSLTVCSQF